jgi:hypothetical protein
MEYRFDVNSDAVRSSLRRYVIQSGACVIGTVALFVLLLPLSNHALALAGLVNFLLLARIGNVYVRWKKHSLPAYFVLSDEGIGFWRCSRCSKSDVFIPWTDISKIAIGKRRLEVHFKSSVPFMTNVEYADMAFLDRNAIVLLVENNAPESVELTTTL